MLRVISGTLKGRKIEQPNLDIVRPTTDKVREAIFSSIQFEIIDSKVLDLFNGSGAIAFEAISRGAQIVDATEKEKKIFLLVKKQIENFKINNFNLYNMTAQNLIKLKQNQKYNFIFLDPPYKQKELLNSTIKQIYEFDILANDGTIIVETNEQDIVLPSGLKILKEKKYGKTFIFYIKKVNEEKYE